MFRWIFKLDIQTGSGYDQVLTTGSGSDHILKTVSGSDPISRNGSDPNTRIRIRNPDDKYDISEYKLLKMCLPYFGNTIFASVPNDQRKNRNPIMLYQILTYFKP